MRFRWFKKNCHSSLRFLLILGMKTSPFDVATDRWIFCSFPVSFSGKIGPVSPVCEREWYPGKDRTGGWKMSCSGIVSARILSLIIAPPIFGLLRPGKLVGGLADFLHGLNIRAHGFHLLIQGAVLGGKAFRFGLPMLRCNLLAGCFQFVQIPHGGVIQGKFHAVRVLKLFPAPSVSGWQDAGEPACCRNTASTWKAACSIVDLAGGGGNFAAQTVIFRLHSGHFCVKLLHGRNAVFLQKVK